MSGVFYAFYFLKFNRTQSVLCAQLHHIAQIAEVVVANYSRFR